MHTSQHIWSGHLLHMPNMISQHRSCHHREETPNICTKSARQSRRLSGPDGPKGAILPSGIRSAAVLDRSGFIRESPLFSAHNRDLIQQRTELIQDSLQGFYHIRNFGSAEVESFQLPDAEEAVGGVPSNSAPGVGRKQHE